MAFDVQNGVTGAINGVDPKPTKTPATKQETTATEEE